MPLRRLQRMFDLSAGFLKRPPECGKHSGADRAPGPDSHSSKFLQMSELSGSDTGTGSSSGSSSAGGGAPPVEHRKPSECCGTGQKSASEQETMGFSRSHMPGEAARGRSGMVCGAGAAGGGCGGLPLCPATGKEPADTGSGAGRAPGPDELYSDMFLRMPAFSGSDTGTGSGSGGSSSGGRAAPVKHRKPSGHRGTGRKSASEQETTGLSCSHMSEQVARGCSGMIWRAGAGGGARMGFSQCTGRCLWTIPLALIEDARKARYALSPEGLRCAMRAVADTSRILAPDGGKVEGFQFQVNGAPVCEAALLIFHDYKRTAFRQALNASRERNALPESGSGVDQKEVATHRHSAAVAWLKEWAESGFVDFMPDDAKVHLPCWLRWDDVHAEYTVDLEAQGETPLKRSQFHRIRTTEFPQLVIPKKVTCVMCTQTRSRIQCYLHQWARVSLGWLFLCPFDDFNACST